MTSTIAKGLNQFVNPCITYKILDRFPRFSKEMHIQMREIEGRQQFGKGMYHNNHYETLIKTIATSRQQYRESKDIQQRKQFAELEFQEWGKYISNRQKELPEDFIFTDKMAYDLQKSYEVFVKRNEQSIQPQLLLEVFNDYTKVHSMNIPIDNWCVLQMIHYNLGYLMNLSRLLPFTDLKRLIEIKTIATYERSLGQDLLFQEICSFAYWELQCQKGYMNPAEFSNFMQLFKLPIEPSIYSVFKEFKFAANLFQGEFSKDIDPKEEIIRFDFFRYLFLERNL